MSTQDNDLLIESINVLKVPYQMKNGGSGSEFIKKLISSMQNFNLDTKNIGVLDSHYRKHADRVINAYINNQMQCLVFINEII